MYKSDYRHALFYIMFYIINTMKKHLTREGGHFQFFGKFHHLFYFIMTLP